VNLNETPPQLIRGNISSSTPNLIDSDSFVNKTTREDQGVDKRTFVDVFLSLLAPPATEDIIVM